MSWPYDEHDPYSDNDEPSYLILWIAGAVIAIIVVLCILGWVEIMKEMFA